MKQNLSMKKHLQAIKIVLCALTLGACVAAQATLPSPNSGMALIPAGPFIRGDANDFNVSHDAPTNTVSVGAFQMDTNLISYASWQQVYNWAINHGYTFSNAGVGTAANHPVQTVNWYSVVKWCNARTEMESNQLAVCYYTDANHTNVFRQGEIVLTSACVDWTANGYRLPTEAEWEKAARGNLSNPNRRFPLGNTISHSQAWYTSSGTLLPYDLGPANVLKTTTTPVGSFAPNGFGLFDMAGNAYEWCWDWYLTNYYTISPTSDPQGPTSGTTRVIRGGSWINEPGQLRCEYRGVRNPASPLNQIGFRCVRGKQSQTISFSLNLTYTYGETIDLTAGASSGLPITFTASGPATISGISSNILTITGAGPVTVTANQPGDATYSAAPPVFQIFTVLRATPVVNATGGTFPYDGTAKAGSGTATGGAGEPLAVTLIYAGKGSTKYGPTNSAPSAAGAYTVTASTAGDANNTAGSSSAVALTINQATPVVNATGGTFPYDGTAQPGSGTATGGAGEPLAVTLIYAGTGSTRYGPKASAPSAAGTYTVTASTAGDANNTAGSSSAVALTINRATPVVNATGGTFPYNGTAQPGSGTATGGAGETLAVALSYAGTGSTSYGPTTNAPSAAGTYTVTASTAGDANNTAGSSSAVALTINKASLSITAINASKVYGQTLNFAGTEFTPTGLVGSDSVSSVTLTSAGATNTAPVANSPYIITPSSAIGSGLGNYSITYNPGYLTVSNAVLTVTHSGNSVIILWPSASTGFVLQQNSNLATTNWTTSSGISDDGTNKSITITSLTGNLFFRLSHP
jgi:formylglycine-generating enzyme required for sulfatase activity